MIRPIFFVTLIINLFFTSASISQIVDLELEVEPELTVQVKQNLDFGLIVSNSGVIEIGFNDFSFGVFEISAYKTQFLSVQLNPPQVLSNQDPAVPDEIPVELNMHYNNRSDDPFAATFIGKSGNIPITNSSVNTMDDPDNWKSVFIYVTGNIEVGNISDGLYSGLAVLTINYN